MRRPPKHYQEFIRARPARWPRTLGTPERMGYIPCVQWNPQDHVQHHGTSQDAPIRVPAPTDSASPPAGSVPARASAAALRGTSTPFHLISHSQRGEKWPDARRASAGIATPLSSSRNKADGCFSPRPKGAPQTRQCCVTALGKRGSYSLRAVPCLGAFGWALRS